MKNIIAENFLRFAPKNLSEADSKKIQQLTEQAPTDKVVNIAITTIPKDAATGPMLIESGATKIITFGPVAKSGMYAVDTRQAVILYLGNYIYMTLGKLGIWNSETQKVETPKVGMSIFDIRASQEASPEAGNTSGFVKPIKTNYNTQNPENAVAVGLVTAFKNMGKGAGEANGAARDFYNKNKSNIVKAFQMASQLGIQQLNSNEIPRDKAVLAYIEQAK